jgi:glycosyltransferase involved in cell wall biosynthesis
MKGVRHPLVAILTPVYNGEKYLHEAMQCVQESDYPNLVHVILDNASTDGTAGIIESFGGHRVPLLVRRNPKTIPMVANFNAMALLAPEEAKYVRVLCADDLMAPTAISKMAAVAESDERVGAVGCLCRNIGLLGEELPSNKQVFDGKLLVRAYLRRETSVFSGTHFLYRREAFGRPPYDDRMGASIDADCAARIALKGHVGFVHEILAEFRHHPESHSATVAGRNGAHLFEWLLLLDRYGPQVMTAAEYAGCRMLYRHYYLRRALLNAAKQRDMHFLRLQRSRLAAIGDDAGPADFAMALAEWLYLAITGQRGRVGMPKRMIFDAPSMSAAKPVEMRVSQI